MKSRVQKLLALVMAFVMLFEMLPTQAMATSSQSLQTARVADASRIIRSYGDFSVPVAFYEKGTTKVTAWLSPNIELTGKNKRLTLKDDSGIKEVLAAINGKYDSAKLATSVSSNNYSGIVQIGTTNKDDSYRKFRYNISSGNDG